LKGESHFETLFAKDFEGVTALSLLELKVDGGYLLKEEASFLRDI
jgi:hypothetical protein